jgi:hypothetical protein
MPGLPEIGLRDAILLLVVLAAIYLVVMVLRLVQAGRKHARGVEDRPESSARPGVKAEAEPVWVPPDAQPVADAVAPAPTFDWEEVKDLFAAAAGEKAPVEKSAASASGFGEPLAEHLARLDVEMEVQRMRDEMDRMRAEMEKLRAARHVSPQYAEAAELVQRGLSAQDVADHLGISLAEAELVHALSRGSKDLERGGDHGTER